MFLPLCYPLQWKLAFFRRQRARLTYHIRITISRDKPIYANQSKQTKQTKQRTLSKAMGMSRWRERRRPGEEGARREERGEGEDACGAARGGGRSGTETRRIAWREREMDAERGEAGWEPKQAKQTKQSRPSKAHQTKQTEHSKPIKVN